MTFYSQNAIVGVSVGLPAIELVPWAASARHADPTCRIVLLSEHPETYQPLADQYGVELRTAWLHRDKSKPVAHEVWKHRWAELRNFLSREQPETRIVFADARDTITQASPFDRLWPKDKLIVGSEGIAFKNESWNRNRAKRHFPAFWHGLADAFVLCAGSIAGHARMLHDFANDMSRILEGVDGEADQVAFNIVLRSASWLNRHIVAEDPWIFHAAQRCPDSMAKKRLYCALPPMTFAQTESGMKVCDAIGRDFVFVHQWPHSMHLLKFLGEIR